MIEITYRIGAGGRSKRRGSVTASSARKKLEAANERFSKLIGSMRSGESSRLVTDISPADLGLDGSECAVQAPYAAILSCSDARVPTEMVFQQGFNDLFVVRVAGNVLGTECLGSLRYAVHHFPDTLKVVAVLGHANCGAVTAAVDAFLEPRAYLEAAGNQPLRTIIDQIMVSARSADMGLQHTYGPDVVKRPGYRKALIQITIALNSAWNAYCLQHELVGYAKDVDVVFSVYDLGSHSLGLIPSPGRSRARNGFFTPPDDAPGFRELVTGLCARVSVS